MGLPKDILEHWLVISVKNFDPSLVGSSRNGTRKISGQLLSPPLTLPSGSRSSSSGAAEFPIAPNPDAAEFEDIEVPVSMFSEEALQFIGFDEQTSRRLLNNWLQNAPEDVSFEDMIFGYLDEACVLNSLEWRRQMLDIGLAQEFQESIMKPEFQDVRETATLAFWVREFMYENFSILEGLNHRVQMNLEILRQGLPQLRGGAQDRSDYHLRQAGHITLYRATSAARLAKVFDGDMLRLEKMCFGRTPPSDFSLEKRAYSWTPQHWVAERFASYTQANCKIPGDIAVLRCLLPSFHADLQTSKTWKLGFGDEWKQVVWHSRCDIIYPDDIHEKWDGANLIIGPVSINHNKEFLRMKSWREVQDENMYVVRGEIAVQYVFMGIRAMAAMNKVVEDKLDLFKCYHPKPHGTDPVIKWIPNPRKWVENRLALGH